MLMVTALRIVTVGAATTADMSDQPASHWTGIAGGARYSVSLSPWNELNISSAPPYVPICLVGSRKLC